MKRAGPSTPTGLSDTRNENVSAKIRRLTENNSNKKETGTSDVSPYFSSGCQNINEAWDSKNYQQVLFLLKKNKPFPKNFSVEDLSDDFEDQKSLRQFVESRINLHEFIKKGDLEEVKKIIQLDKSKYYLNTKNESALYVAIKNEQYDIYAYLESKDVKFKSVKEKKTLDNLNKSGLYYLKKAKEPCFQQKEKGHINFLVSKSFAKTEGQKKHLENVQKYYEELDKVSEMSTVLKVLQYADFLRIIFDFDAEEVKGIMPTNARLFGHTRHKEGKIFIAASAKRGKKAILGTMAHEFTHMATQITYNNDCNPYFASNIEEKTEFANIIKDIKEKNKENHFIGPPSAIFLSFLNDELDEESEAIVRVTQIIVQYSLAGKVWLKAFAEDLYNYFCDKVLPNYIKIIENSVHKKSADTNRELNKVYVEVNKIMEYDVYFEKVSDEFKNLLTFERGILLLYAENVLLTLVRVLQQMYGKHFNEFNSEYGMFNLENLSKQKMYDVFSSEPANVGFIENSNYAETEKIEKTLSAIKELLVKRPNLKFIFITNKNEENIKNTLKGLNINYTEGNDIGFHLNDLDDESKENLLYKKVMFLGKEIELRQLIGDGKDFLTTNKIDIISKLCGGEYIQIGGRVIGTSSLEGAYADVIQEIDLENFKSGLKNSNDVFVIEGIQPNKKEDILNYLDITLEKCEEYKKGSIISKRILFPDWNLTDDDFKKFCKDQENAHNKEKPGRKFFWINLNKKGPKTKPTFILKQCYYPDFYLKRKFKEKIIIKTKINDLLRSKNSEIFLIGCKESDKKTLNQFTNPQVEILNMQDAQARFDDLSERNKVVHLFKVEKEEVIWKNSSGTILNLKKCLNQKFSNKFLISEKDFIKEIFNKKMVLISDDPGMGKSTTVTKLYEEPCGQNTIMDTHWLIRINLKDHLKAIRKIKREAFDVKKIISFLSDVDPSLNNDLCFEMLNLALSKQKYFKKPLLIVFDGFDELSDESSRQKIHSLLHFLKKETKCKLWVTTRRHYKDELEKELCTLAMEFSPVKDDEMRKFIKKYLSHRLSLVLDKGTNYLIFGQNETVQKNTRMWKYTKFFIEKMRFIFKKDAAKFIGAPLQLCLMLEDAVWHFKEYVRNADRIPDFSFFGNEPNLLNIYEKFIDMKYTVYFKKKNLEEDFFKKSVEKFCGGYSKALAESLTLNNEFKNFDEEDTINMLSIGIIKRQNENLEFIHFTFREYFSAQVFIEYLKDERFKKRNFNLAEILVKNIFLQPDYQLMRTFFNLHLEKLNFDRLPKYILKEIGEMIALLWGRKPCLIVNEGTVLHVALEENNMNIYNLVFLGCKTVFTDEVYSQFLLIKNKRQQTLFHVAASMGKKNEIEELIDTVLEKLKPQLGLELFEMKDKNGTALKLAENKKNEKIAEKLRTAQMLLEA